MQLNKPFSLLIPLLVLAACSKQTSNQLLLDRWVSKEKETSIVERRLAASGNAECMIDTFTEETLKAEIAQIEEKYKKEQKLEGNFEHLDFRDLPVTQAKFLKSYGSSLGDHSKEIKFDYSSCTDVPCILNKIYGQDSGVEGYAIYLWYLKTGHTLAVDNFVYEQKSKVGGEYQGKKFPLKDYLFSKDELYAFWRMSHMLSPTYKTLGNLKEIQRLPRGAKFENAGALTCGLAWSSGWVQVSDSCLTFGYNNKDSGFIYESVTHELAHQIDYHEGAKLRKSYRSQEADWLNASGWELKEERTGEGQTQRITRTYSIKSGFTQFASSYAQTSPAENFADTLSLYVHNGDHTKKSIPVALYDIVKKGYYGEEEYTLDNNIYRITQKHYPRYLKDVLDLTVSCLDPSTDSKSVYFNGVNFQQKIPPLILSCMGARAEELEKTVIAYMKMTEAEGCNISKIKLNGLKKFQDSWKKVVADQIDDAFSKMKNDSGYLARIKEFYEKLAKDSDPQKVYVACYGEADEKGCFDQKLRELAESKVSALKPSQAQAEEMIKLYQDSFSYQSVRDQVSLYYQNFLKGQSAAIVQGAEGIWGQCLQVKADDKEAPTGTLFNVGSSYMVSSLYNCINYGLPDAVRNTVRSLEIDGQRVQDGKEELLVKSLVMPLMVSELKEYFNRDTAEELKKIEEYIAANKDSLESQVKGSFAWATNYVDNQKIVDDCKQSVLKNISIVLYFHKKSESMNGMLDGICSPIPKSSEFTKYLDSIRGEFEGKSFQTLEGYVLEAAADVAKECLAKFPADTALNRVKFREQRESCLKNQWPAIEKTALGRLNAEPLVIKFKIDTSGYAARLKTRARVLQLKTFKEYFEK